MFNDNVNNRDCRQSNKKASFMPLEDSINGAKVRRKLSKEVRSHLLKVYKGLKVQDLLIALIELSQGLIQTYDTHTPSI
ncbi:CLUMA_CG006941, isoform A [Clunio marinus]|uniref:CLUMA_CG006941, isoform A n=1 Tax=Clunio marinus TaxID=568069 RepID=A0A1J1HZF2_9DIPT|nr:CLUMA_CG006941, isoform A [Clunio marinus]